MQTMPPLGRFATFTPSACLTHVQHTGHMRQIPVREVNQHTADVSARVDTGERVEITRNSRWPSSAGGA